MIRRKNTKSKRSRTITKVRSLEHAIELIRDLLPLPNSEAGGWHAYITPAIGLHHYLDQRSRNENYRVSVQSPDKRYLSADEIPTLEKLVVRAREIIAELQLPPPPRGLVPVQPAAARHESRSSTTSRVKHAVPALEYSGQ